MSILTQESRAVQNPALGATLIWRFANAYTDAHRTKDLPVLPLAYIVLPIVFHKETCELVAGTQKQTGLHGFVEKFARTDVAKLDVLLGIHTRALALRTLTTESIQIAIRRRLVTLLSASGQFAALSQTPPSAVPKNTRPLLTAAEKLGAWCSPLSLFEIASALKVAF
jgi:hypothetical protein